MKRNLYNNLAFAETAEDAENLLSGLGAHGLKASQTAWLPVEIDADLFLRQKGIVPAAPTELLSIEDRKRIFWIL